jgi:hypothetical protein
MSTVARGFELRLTKWLYLESACGDPELPSPAHRLLCALASCADGGKKGRGEWGANCFPSRATLAKKAGMTVRQVERNLRVLEESGYVRRHRMRGARGRLTSSLAQFLLPERAEFGPWAGPVSGGSRPGAKLHQPAAAAPAMDPLGDQGLSTMLSLGEQDHALPGGARTMLPLGEHLIDPYQKEDPNQETPVVRTTSLSPAPPGPHGKGMPKEAEEEQEQESPGSEETTPIDTPTRAARSSLTWHMVVNMTVKGLHLSTQPARKDLDAFIEALEQVGPPDSPAALKVYQAVSAVFLRPYRTWVPPKPGRSGRHVTVLRSFKEAVGLVVPDAGKLRQVATCVETWQRLNPARDIGKERFDLKNVVEGMLAIPGHAAEPYVERLCEKFDDDPAIARVFFPVTVARSRKDPALKGLWWDGARHEGTEESTLMYGVDVVRDNDAVAGAMSS